VIISMGSCTVSVVSARLVVFFPLITIAFELISGDVWKESWVQAYSLVYKNIENIDSSISVAGSTEVSFIIL
jgi:hypothetical protein